MSFLTRCLLRTFGLTLCICLLLPSEIPAVSPRIMVTLDKSSEFTAHDLVEHVEGIVIAGSSEEMKSKIKKLDRSHPIHVMIIEDLLDDVDSFASKMGYVRLHLNIDFISALTELQIAIKTTPSSEADLPKIDPFEAGLLYDLMMKVDHILKEFKINYWAIAGTLLGAVRHGGIIPWDNDIDISIFERDLKLFKSQRFKDALEAAGLQTCRVLPSDFYKIFPKDGVPIFKEDRFFPWKYPFIDVFTMKLLNNRVTYSSKIVRAGYPQDYFRPADLSFPLKEVAFGPMTIPIPENSIDNLKRAYGEDWKDVAYLEYDHRSEHRLKKIKVDLLDLSPPDYILPPPKQEN